LGDLEKSVIGYFVTYIFLKATGLPFLHGHKISMRNDHLYGDPDYSWDEYI